MKSTIENFEDVEKSILELSKHESFIAKEEARMNEKIQKIKDEFEEKTKESRAAKNLVEGEIQAFCTLNKKEFEKTRTKKLIHGLIGFRFNPPKVLQLNRKYSVQTSIELIKKIFKSKYIRSKEEINKDEILIGYDKKELDDQKLAAIGLKIDQSETFFIKIDWESLESEAAA